MKIYFAASIRGGREDSFIYSQIIDYLSDYGDVLTEHIGSPNLNKEGECHMSDLDIHDRDMKWLVSSDIIIAEVTNPSLGVGYEIGRALEYGKKIICLHSKESKSRLSAMISGSRKIRCIKYSDIDDLKESIGIYLKKNKK